MSTTLSITVKPNSSKGPLIESDTSGMLTIYVRESAFDNQANKALIKLLAKHFNVPKNTIIIIRGHTSRHKIIEIQ
jgi:uncharacterized protein (TIGR00251 family)